MFLRKVFHILFLVIIAISINLNIVDDRFISPLEDISNEIQTYEFEETTRVFSFATKKQNHVSRILRSLSAFEKTDHAQIHVKPAGNGTTISESLLIFYLLNLPPPSLA